MFNPKTNKFEPDYFTPERLDLFIKNNYDKCKGLCEEWQLEIETIEDLRQAAEYLLNQI